MLLSRLPSKGASRKKPSGIGGKVEKWNRKPGPLHNPLFRSLHSIWEFHVNERLSTSASTGDFFSQLHLPLTDTNHQCTMRESQLGSHTVRSHGARLAYIHMHDWLVLVLLGFIIVVLNLIQPFYRFVGKDMMSDLRYPFKPNTVPVWFVPVYAVLFPIAVFLIFYLRQRDVYDLHHAVLGIMYSVLITGVVTDAIKDAVGRPRPNFFWRCFPDGKDAYDQLGNVICHGNEHDIMEGHKSFPSGHTSWSFAGLAFLSLYLSGKIKAFDGRGHIAKLCVVVLPLLLAALVAISRVDDYWHHWQDVFTGALLGLLMATVCYLQFFPPPYHIDGWKTYAYVSVLEQLRRNSSNGHNSVAEVEIQPNQRNPVEDLESGMR